MLSCNGSRHISNKLKLAKVISILKKELTDLFTNYCLISLLPFLSKIFESLSCNRLISFFDVTNAIVSARYGFRQNRTKIHVVLDLIAACYDNKNKNKLSALLFLDRTVQRFTLFLI